MKFIKLLSLITIISYAPALHSMEDNTSQEQSRVPKLADLCRQKRIGQINAVIYAKPNTYGEAVARLNDMNNQFQIATFGLVDGLYNSNEIFQHCIDLIVNKIWNQCQNVTGITLDTILHEIRQSLFSKIPSENLSSFIEAHLCKQKSWHVPHCLKEFNNVWRVNFSSDNSLLFVSYMGGRGGLIDAKGEVIKDNVDDVNYSPDSSLMFVRYGDNRGELINVQTGVVLKKFNNVYDINFSPDSSLMVVRYRNDNLIIRVELIDAKTREVIKVFNNFVWVDFAPNSSLMFVDYRIDNDGNTRGELINTKTWEIIKEFNNVDRTLVDFAPNSSLMIVGYWDGGRELIDAKTGNVIKDNVYWVDFSSDSSLMVVRYWDARGELINTKTWEVIKKLNNIVNIDRVNFSPDSSLIFVKYLGGRGELIDAKSGAIIKEFNNFDRFNFSPNSSMMFVKYTGDRGELINVQTGVVLKKFNDINIVYFSPDSSLMFVEYTGDRGELINAKTGHVIRDNVSFVYFSPDSSLMFVSYPGDRGELLCAGNFEQIIFKCALRNTLQMHKEQQSDEIKQGLTTLLNHRILITLPEKSRDILSKEITDVLQNKDSSALELLNK